MKVRFWEALSRAYTLPLPSSTATAALLVQFPDQEPLCLVIWCLHLPLVSDAVHPQPY